MHVFDTIYRHPWQPSPVTGDLSSLLTVRKRAARNKHRALLSRLIGLGMIALALGGMTGPFVPRMALEAKYAVLQLERGVPTARLEASRTLAALAHRLNPQVVRPEPAPAAAETHIVPAAFDPLKAADGSVIEPVNRDFALVVPKIGVNAPIIPAVNPTRPGEYLKALETGIAHSSLSYFPDEDGTVYLFSHSTNYEWFVGDLNAVFYLLKNLETDDMVVIFYKNRSYTYKITGKQIVKPTSVAYLAPEAGVRKLILQTCWPPGSTTERLLIFADLVETQNEAI